jgi:type II secretory pathway component HofQ
MGRKQPAKPTKRASSRKSVASPDVLTKTGKKAAIELSEAQLGTVVGGCAEGKHLVT